MIHPRILSALAAGILLAAAAAPADIVVFNNGDRREGRVEAAPGDPSRVSFTSNGQVLQIPRSSIREIIEQTDAEDFTILGDQFVALKSYQRAVRMYQRALDASPGHEPARRGLENARALITQQEAESERRMVDGFGAAIEEARQLIADQDFARAESKLDNVLANSPSDQQRATAGTIQRELYLQWGLSRWDRLDPVGAEEYLNKALALDPDNTVAREALLEVWSNDPTKREQVLGEYLRRLQVDPDDLELNRKVVDLLVRLNRGSEAIEPLKRLVQSARYRALGYDERLQSAMHGAAVHAANTGDIDAGISMYRDLLNFFPGSDPTPLLLMQYEKKREELDPNDWEGKARLLPGLVEQGLVSYAVDEAELILRSDPSNAVALGIVRGQAERRIGEMQRALASGEYYIAMAAAEDFIKNVTRFTDLTERAADIARRASLEAERVARENRQQAREIAENARRYYSMAMRNAELMSSREADSRSFAISYKREATLNAERAVQAYEAALRIDPSLGPITGMGLTTELADARRLLANLTRDPDYRPTRQRRPLVSNPTRN